MRGVVLLSCAVVCLAIPHRVNELHNLLKPWYWEPNTATITLEQFSWASCGTDSDIANIQSLKLTPDPIEIPGTVVGAGLGSLSKDAVSPLKTVVKLFKKAVVWVPIPCVDNIGSCTYDDICTLLANVTIPSCPVQSCVCPFPAGTYDVSKGISVDIPKPPKVPSWLADGDFKIEATVTNAAKEEIFCLIIVVSVHLNNVNGTEPQRVEMRSRQWEFSHAANHQDAVIGDSTCDPATFVYDVCNLTSTDPRRCPAGYHCQEKRCPIPGLCWWPKNCECDAETKKMTCTQSPGHEGECNTEDCGVCEVSGHRGLKEFAFHGSELVPTHLCLENNPARYELMHNSP